MSAAELRLVECGECERLRHQLAATLVELENARAETSGLRRQVASLRSQGAKKLESDPRFDVAQRLFEVWQETCGHPRAVLGPKRLKAVLAALDRYEPRDIAKAIRGASVGAFTDERGVRHDDIELICRDEVKLEKFIERYERWKGAGG